MAPSANTVIEGSNVTFTVTTTDFGNGVLYWTTAGTATGNDFVAANGNVTITGDSGSFIISAVADQITEGEKTFFVQLRTDSISGNIVANSSNVTITDPIDDPIEAVADYLVIAGGGGGGSGVVIIRYHGSAMTQLVEQSPQMVITRFTHSPAAAHLHAHHKNKKELAPWHILHK